MYMYIKRFSSNRRVQKNRERATRAKVKRTMRVAPNHVRLSTLSLKGVAGQNKPGPAGGAMLHCCRFCCGRMDDGRVPMNANRACELCEKSKDHRAMQRARGLWVFFVDGGRWIDGRESRIRCVDSGHVCVFCVVR